MRPNPIVGCDLVREAISAMCDGEAPPIPETAAGTHLAGCQGCRAFQAEVMALARQMSLTVLPPIPDRTSEIIASLGIWETAQTAQTAQTAHAARARRSRDRRRISWGRASQWAASVVPLGLAVPALALGVFGHPHIVPSHVLTPCTMFLAHHFRG